MHSRAEQLIKFLSLNKHPEGGYFSEYYRSEEIIPQNSLPERYSGDRCFSTSIYFLLNGGDCSKFHKIKSDEIWHFYEGAPVMLISIAPDGKFEKMILGNNFGSGESIQFVIKHGRWFGAYPLANDGYSLVGCTVAPGFDFADFELAKKEELISRYPNEKEIIDRLT